LTRESDAGTAAQANRRQPVDGFGRRPPIRDDFDRLEAAQLGAPVAQAPQAIADRDKDRGDNPKSPSEWSQREGSAAR
jgi:hypothetical protein